MSAPQLQRLKGQGLATGVWIQDQADLSAESVDEFGAVLDALEQPLGAGGELVEGAGKQVAQVTLDVRPHALGGVELAGVGRQLNTVSQSECASQNARITALRCTLRLSQIRMIGACRWTCAAAITPA